MTSSWCADNLHVQNTTHTTASMSPCLLIKPFQFMGNEGACSLSNEGRMYVVDFVLFLYIVHRYRCSGVTSERAPFAHKHEIPSDYCMATWCPRPPTPALQLPVNKWLAEQLLQEFSLLSYSITKHDAYTYSDFNPYSTALQTPSECCCYGAWHKRRC